MTEVYETRSHCLRNGDNSEYCPRGWEIWRLAAGCLTAKAADRAWNALGEHMALCEKGQVSTAPLMAGKGKR